MKNKSKNIKIIACVISLISLLYVCGISAYFTDIDVVSNKFTVGQVKIALRQSDYIPPEEETNESNVVNYAESIVPNAVINKDPKIENTGVNDAYVYLKVKVPVRKIVTANEDGTLRNSGTATNTELFTYQVTGEGWQNIASANEAITNAQDEPEYNTYVYSYNKTLKKGELTPALFTSVKFANVVDNQLDEESYNLDIEAYAIQSTNLPNDTTINDAYNLYLNQNQSI